jgi:hypothetical protein
MPASKRRAVSKAEMNAARAVLKVADELQASHISYDELIIKLAQEEQEEREHRYRTFTIFSYCLFGIGWTISLVGKALGVEGAEESEEE